MPLVIVCGFPSSGKTYRASQIVQYFEQKTNPALDDSAHAGTKHSDTRNPAQNTIDDAEETSLYQPPLQKLSELNLRRSEAALASQTDAPPGSLDNIVNHSLTSLNTAANARVSEPAAAQSLTRPRRAINSRTIETNRPRLQVHHISDHTLHLPRSAYAASKTEKDARAALYSAVKRALTKNDVVVLDSGNYIKGWRYQLYCEAKNLGTGSCVVHVGVPPEKAKEVNDRRLEQIRDAGNADVGTTQAEDTRKIGGTAQDDAYDETVHAELLMRFEEPNEMARWDSPLFTVIWEDAAPPCERIWEELVESVGKDGKSKVIRPNQATVLPPTTSSTHLYLLDRTTQSIVSQIQEYQSNSPGDGGGVINVNLTIASSSSIATDAGSKAGVTKRIPLRLPTQTVSFPQLQRLRRQFITLHRQQLGSMGMGAVGNRGGDEGGKRSADSSSSMSEQKVGELFIGFLEGQWSTDS